MPAAIKLFAKVMILCVCVLGLAGSDAMASAPNLTCSAPFISVSTPLNDLGPNEYIRMDGTPTGMAGGLYPGGSNNRPAAHEAAGSQIASQIMPLNGAGIPDAANGKIGLVSIGMSNTTQEFQKFVDQVAVDPQVNPQVVLIDGAEPSASSSSWANPNDEIWERLISALDDAGMTGAQVQVAWIKLAQIGSGLFPQKAQSLQADLESSVQNLQQKYPSIRLVYFSSRTRAYVYWDGLSPEPDAFETGFSVKWLIDQQIQGDMDLNFDPANGPVTSPWLSWGPYLWIDGLNPRSDGMVWTPNDLAPDCVHPSDAGKQKVADQLSDFFKTDSTTAVWFLGEGVEPPNYSFQLFLPTVQTLTRRP